MLSHFLKGLGLVILLSLGPGCQSPLQTSSSPSPEHAVRYYQRILRKHPERYPVRVQLAMALLERARSTHDVTFLRQAREQALQALDQQPTYEGYVVMARIQNFSHQFTNAMQWSQLAMESSASGTRSDEISSLQLEALLGLGQTEEAKKVLPTLDPKDPSWFGHAAWAQWWLAMGHLDQASRAFAQSALLAESNGIDQLALWGEINAAGCHIDQGHASLALPFLQSARKRNPEDPLLRLHEAEYLELTGHLEEAYRLLVTLARQTEDPNAHAQAWRIARQLNRAKEAQRHFQAAEAGFKRILDTGEIYSLASLAQLYLDANIHHEEVLQWAEMNWAHVKDRQARSLLQEAQHRQGFPDKAKDDAH